MEIYTKLKNDEERLGGPKVRHRSIFDDPKNDGSKTVRQKFVIKKYKNNKS